MAYPVTVAAISIVFGAMLLRQYLQRGRLYQLLWAAALFMSFAASAAYAGAVALDSGLLFKAYYLLGALWMAAYLGQGSLYLVMRPAWAHGAFALLVLLSAAGAVLMMRAPLDAAALMALEGGPGVDVMEIGTPLLLLLIALNTYGVAAVAGIALYSIWRYHRRDSDVRFVTGNAGIASGAILNGLAGTLARWGGDAAAWFWLTMAAGWSVIFVGFLLINAADSRSAKARQRAAAGRSGTVD